MTFLTRGGLGYPGSTLPYVGLGRPCEKPTWKPSRMHRYHGGTSSILYNMSNLGSAGKGACWSLADVPAESPTSCCFRAGREGAAAQGKACATWTPGLREPPWPPRNSGRAGCGRHPPQLVLSGPSHPTPHPAAGMKAESWLPEPLGAFLVRPLSQKTGETKMGSDWAGLDCG